MPFKFCTSMSLVIFFILAMLSIRLDPFSSVLSIILSITVKPLSQRQILAALQLAMGKTPKEVAENLEIAYVTISLWKTNPRFKLAIAEATKEIKNRMIDDHEEKIKKRLEETFEPSMKELERIRDGTMKSVAKLESGEEIVGVGARLTAAKFLVEQVVSTAVSKRVKETDDSKRHATINLPPQLAKVLVQAIAEDDGKPVPIDITDEQEETS